MPLDGSAEDEIRRFEEQFRRQPESLVFARLADAYRKAGEQGRALDLLEEGIARHPDYLSAHIVRARTFRDLGREDEARGAFRRVLELDAQNLVALRGLADLARLGGDPDGERDWLRRLVQADPFNEEPAARLADLEAAVGTPGPEADGPEPTAPVAELPDAVAELPDAVEELPDAEAELPDAEATLPDAETEPPGAEESGLPEPWWFEETEPVPEAAEEEIAEDADLLTRTMAELYARQGFLDEAEEIYRELLRDRPEEAELRAGLDAVLGMRAARAAARGPAASRPPGPEAEEPPAAGPEEATGVPEPRIGDELRDLLEAGRDLGPRLPVPPETGADPGPSPAVAPEAGRTMDEKSRPSVLEDWLRRLRE